MSSSLSSSGEPTTTVRVEPDVGTGKAQPEYQPVPTNDIDTPKPEVRTTVMASIAVCSFYVGVSATMVFMNKALSYSYKFRTTNLLLLIQMLFQIVALHLGRYLTRLPRRDEASLPDDTKDSGERHGHPPRKSLIEFQPFQLRHATRILPVSIFYSLNLAFALAALREMSVPSYSMIKRLAPLTSLFLEYVMLQKVPRPLVVASLLLMAVGTVLVAYADASSTVLGWVYGCASNVLQGLYLVYAAKLLRGMSSLSVLYYHSILSVPCMIILVIAVGEVPEALQYIATMGEYWARTDFAAVLLATLSMGLLLNYALFLCTELTSATSTLVSGQVKAMGQTVLGLFTFGGVEVTPMFAMGLTANVVGGGGYAWAKYKALQEK